MPRGGDRRSQYNEARHKVLVSAVRAGNYRGTAARMAGISKDAFRHWLRAGEAASFDEVPYDAPEGKYRKLFEDVEEAEAAFEAEMVGRVVTAAEEPANWTAAMTILERTRPEKFGRRATTVIEGGNPIQIVTAALLADPDRLEASNQLLAQLARPAVAELPPGSADYELPGLEAERLSVNAELARVQQHARI